MNREYKAFHGGIIDAYFAAGDQHSKTIDNLWIDENGKLYTRWGLKSYQTRFPVSANSKRISGVILDSEPYDWPLVTLGNKMYHVTSDDWYNEITGPAGNVAMPDKGDSDMEDAILWRKQVIYGSPPGIFLPHRIYCSAYSTDPTFECLTLGLPALASDPTFTVAGGSYNFLYAFIYQYSFTDYDGFTFEEVSAPIYVDPGAHDDDPGTSSIAIAAIPALSNGLNTNYDTANINVYIYRTLNNGTTYYYNQTISNGTTTATDDIADSDIINQDTLYITGNVVENDQPPVGSRFVAQVNDFFWWATENYVTHSKQGAPGHCPDEYYWYTDKKIKGLNNTLSFPILFTDGPVYRLEGNYDEFGDGGFSFRDISQTAGCISNRSIVRVPGGLVWAGNGGFYFTDGYQVNLISRGIPFRYNTWKNTSIAGVYDSVNNFVQWSIDHDGSEDSYLTDRVVTLHLEFGWENGYGVFSTWGSDRNFYPVSFAFSESSDIAAKWRSKLLVGEARGYLLYQDENAYSDPVIDISKVPVNFKKRAIIHRLEGIGQDYGTDALRKYCTHITAAFQVETELSVQFITRRDDDGSWEEFSEIRADGPIIFGLTEWWDWDDDDLSDSDILSIWNGYSIAEGMRHFPSGSLRSLRRQIGFTNSFTYIARSDDYDTVTIDATNRTVTLASGAWPLDCEDYYLYFSDDTYDTGFKIKDRTSDTVVEVYDPLAELTADSAIAWEMKGYRKNERAYLLSYTVNFDEGEETFTPNRGNSDYRNA